MDFKDLYIFDLANNHQGDVNHGLKIIREVAKHKNPYIRLGIKLQLRDLKSIIHPDKKIQAKNEYLKRFQDTKLSRLDIVKLINEIKKQGMLCVATPFDEKSLDIIKKYDVDIIKIASCSNTDYPLIDEIKKIDKPIILSTGGISFKHLDYVVDKLKDKELCILHCVAIYPTDINNMQLNQIKLLKNRYPNRAIGFSSHANPAMSSIILAAYANGARTFESHVGMDKLNNYSIPANEVNRWIRSLMLAIITNGSDDRGPSSKTETDSLNQFRRGAYASRDIQFGEILRDVYYCMPLLEGQLRAGELKEGILADKDYKKDEMISENILWEPSNDMIKDIKLEVKAMLKQANIHVNKDAKMSISHHYGIGKFREYGAVLIDCINRAYCKKIIVQLPGQKHPYHYHKKKEEMFQLLYGDMVAVKEGYETKLEPGDLFLVRPGEWHAFYTLNGGIFEEVSTTQFPDDSVYEDRYINVNKNRKTYI